MKRKLREDKSCTPEVNAAGLAAPIFNRILAH